MLRRRLAVPPTAVVFTALLVVALLSGCRIELHAVLEQKSTVEIAPGVHMPLINLGTCCGSESLQSVPVWLSAGGRGIDTAFD